MTTATRLTKANRPASLAHRLQNALTDVTQGVHPQRAFDFHSIPQHWRDDSRIHHLVRIAEAECQRTAVYAVQTAGTKGSEARQLPDVPEGTSASGRLARARVTARAWETKDWRAPAWLLERRFPAEWGQQQPAQTAEAVIEVLKAIASLRAGTPAELSVRRPKALPETVDGTPGVPGTP